MVMRMDWLCDKRILIVDDEVAIRDMVSGILQGAGFRQVGTAPCCADARRMVADWQPDAMLLDVMLPDGDGFSLFEEMRGQGRDIPVLFLSARDEDESRLTGLGLGADDYITKPFLPRELVLRLTAVLRRTYGSRHKDSSCNILRIGNIAIDWGSGIVTGKTDQQTLTAKEYVLLRKLYENRGNIVTIDALCMAAWGDGGGYENTLMVHIRRLREKIEENPSRPRWLVTVRGLGYRLEKERGT